MNIAKELNEMGEKAGGDGRAILTIEATTMPITAEDFNHYTRGRSTFKEARATKVSLFVSLSRGRDIAVDRTRRLGEPVIAEVLHEGWEAINMERDDLSFMERLNIEASKLKKETARIVGTRANRLAHTITCGELDVILNNIKEATSQLQRIQIMEEQTV